MSDFANDPAVQLLRKLSGTSDFKSSEKTLSASGATAMAGGIVLPLPAVVASGAARSCAQAAATSSRAPRKNAIGSILEYAETLNELTK